MKTSSAQGEVRAFLEEGSEFEGNLNFTGVVRINGKFKGEIKSDDTLIIGPSAIVEANLHVGSATIGGTVNGEIHASHRLEIQASAKITAAIHTPAIMIHEGAQIMGAVEVKSAESKSSSKHSKAS